VINSILVNAPEFEFEDSSSVIAFVCDLGNELDPISVETFINFCKHLNLPINFTIGILATKQSFFNPAGITSYKQILKRLLLIKIVTN
jgi:hypothetical protein